MPSLPQSLIEEPFTRTLPFQYQVARHNAISLSTHNPQSNTLYAIALQRTVFSRIDSIPLEEVKLAWPILIRISVLLLDEDINALHD